MSLATISKLAALIAMTAFFAMLVGYICGAVTGSQTFGSALTAFIACLSAYAMVVSKKTENG